jgi:hypothetical protein
MRESMVLICPTEQVRMHAADWRDGQFVHGMHAAWRIFGISAAASSVLRRQPTGKSLA